MHEDKILLRLKRKYTKDEEVSFILKALADAQFENGVLKSEIAELKANNRAEKKRVEKPKEPIYPETVVNGLRLGGRFNAAKPLLYAGTVD